jgi:hypothetical protein
MLVLGQHPAGLARLLKRLAREPHLPLVPRVGGDPPNRLGQLKRLSHRGHLGRGGGYDPPRLGRLSSQLYEQLKLSLRGHGRRFLVQRA